MNVYLHVRGCDAKHSGVKTALLSDDVLGVRIAKS